MKYRCKIFGLGGKLVLKNLSVDEDFYINHNIFESILYEERLAIDDSIVSFREQKIDVNKEYDFQIYGGFLDQLSLKVKAESGEQLDLGDVDFGYFSINNTYENISDDSQLLFYLKSERGDFGEFTIEDKSFDTEKIKWIVEHFPMHDDLMIVKGLKYDGWKVDFEPDNDTKVDSIEGTIFELDNYSKNYRDIVRSIE